MRSSLSVFRRVFAGGEKITKITSRQAVADERGNGVRTACGDVRMAEFMWQVPASVHVLCCPFWSGLANHDGGPRFASIVSGRCGRSMMRPFCFVDGGVTARPRHAARRCRLRSGRDHRRRPHARRCSYCRRSRTRHGHGRRLLLRSSPVSTCAGVAADLINSQ